MICLWLAVALLSASWLFGLEYYYPARPQAWFACVAAGVALMIVHAVRRTVARDASWFASSPAREMATALVLLLPALWFIEPPYKVAALLLASGAALALVPNRNRWWRGLTTGTLTAGATLLAQAVALRGYMAFTSRGHDLPWPLAAVMALLLRLVGIDAAADDGSIILHTQRQMHRFAATWDWLVDPVSVLFFVGGGVATVLVVWTFLPAGTRWLVWRRWLGTLALVMFCWLPLRAVLLVAVYIARVVRFNPDWPLHALNHVFSPWSLGLLCLIPTFVLARLMRSPVGGESPGRSTVGGNSVADRVVGGNTVADRRRSRLLQPLGVALVFLAAFMLAWPLCFHPSGARKEGRVLFVERKSQWEPTTKPYDTTWYVQPEMFHADSQVNSGYNYYVIYDWLSRYYDTARLLPEQKLDRAALRQCDVLVIKTPTERYTHDEIRAVRRFVEEGGSLLLIGDHTNYARSGTILNDLCRPMGFTYRPDLLFRIGGWPYDQLYTPPRAAHPIVQRLPPMDFEVSCSIDPGRSWGAAAVRGAGLFSMGPDHYHSDNFHPVPQHVPEMRVGPFVQVWAASYGQGRVVAFTDSTIFSNFCLPQEGKADIMFGMVEWLNHEQLLGHGAGIAVAVALMLLAVSLLAAGVWLHGKGVRNLFLVVAAALGGWAVGVGTVEQAHRLSLPAPQAQRDFIQVVVDREVSQAPLSKGSNIRGDGRGFGLAEQWMQRLGWFVTRRGGLEVFDSNVLVIFQPTVSPSAEYRRRLGEYVDNGGRVIVVDTGDNTDSTANELLEPFGLSFKQLKEQDTLVVVGGEPITAVSEGATAAIARRGKGAITAVGSGGRFNDDAFGREWMMEPTPEIRQRYDAWFALLRRAVEDKPVAAPAKPPATTPDEPMREEGIKEPE